MGGGTYDGTEVVEHGDRNGTAEGKPRFSLLSVWATEGLAKVFTAGAKKYAAHNWAKGLSWSETIDSLERHLAAFKKGEELDDGPGGTGLPHIDQVAWNAHVLSHFTKLSQYAAFDDRWKPKK